MIKEVFKKGGRMEVFNPEKIKNSITLAVEKSKFPQEKKQQIIEKVFLKVMEFLKQKREISTAEIEAKILLEFDELAPEISKIWREYRAAKK